MKPQIPQLSVRRAPVRAAGPKSCDPEARTVEFVAATERPVRMWDWDNGGEIDEVLLMQGAVLPRGRQIPLLDTHSRYGVDDVLGSARDLRVEENELVSTVHLSKVGKADETLTKIAEGHLTDCSIGYRISDYTTVRKGEQAVIGGRTWKGPVRVVTSWIPKELSVCPIGADEAAKARSEGGGGLCVEITATDNRTQKEPAMTDQERQELDELRKLKAEKDEEARKASANDTVTEIRRQAAAEEERIKKKELERHAKIRKIAAEWESKGIDLGDLAAQGIQNGDTIEAFEEKARTLGLNLIAKQRTDGLTFDGPVTVTADERDKFRACAVASLFVRSGHEKYADEKYRTGHDLASLSLRDLALKAQRVANVSGPLWSQRTITSSDLPYILGDFQNKFIAEGYNSTSVTFRQWCKIATVSNAQTIHLPIPSQVSKAPKISMNGGEYENLAISDAQETVSLVKRGGIVEISEKALMNDDVLGISASALGLGESIIHGVNVMVYGDGSAADPGTLFGAAGAGETMRDSTALFTSGHANYVAHGSGAVPSVSTLNTARAAMRKQTDISGTRPLNWEPRYLIVPAALESTGWRELKSEKLIDGTATAASGELNPNFNRMELVVEPLLDTISTDAAAQWYVAADKGRAVWVFFHESTNDRPQLEQRQEWINDSLSFKGHVKVAVKACDWRGLYCNHGN